MEPHSDTSTMLVPQDQPRGDLRGFVKYLRHDFLSGFLVFLIALPLCLGISLACGYPALAGIFTAIIGSVVATFLSNSELTIKGPAAGLIVVAVGCIEAFGGDGTIGGFDGQDLQAYRMALAVGVVAALLQIVFGLLRCGVLGELFPLSAVHGMLAAIGVIIIVKQLPVALGVQASDEPLEMIEDIPEYFEEMNPEIALIGLVGVLIMFLWPLLQRRFRMLKAIPAALLVIVATVPLGMAFNLTQDHSYTLFGNTYEVDESYLVDMPDEMFGMFEFITFPDFSAFDEDHRGTALWWAFMFFAIGSLESILSAKAVDIIDPWKRKTSMDRDLLAVGAGNLCASLIGGLPMISEIVRSKANIDNGACTRFANMWHGLFLLVCVALIPTVLHLIPLAALASMLIYTGFRLTHPREFLHVYQIGKEQFLIFVATLIGVLATDILIGILIGIAMELTIHVLHGVPLRSLFKPFFDVELVGENEAIVRARHSAIFSNWILFRRQLVRLGLLERRNVVLDLSRTKLVDHSVMEKLRDLQRDFAANGVALELRGLNSHKPLSSHELSARVRAIEYWRRITVIGPEGIEQRLHDRFLQLGVSHYTAIPCRGGAPGGQPSPSDAAGPQCRVETIVRGEIAEQLVEYLRSELHESPACTLCVENVEALQLQ